MQTLPAGIVLHRAMALVLFLFATVAAPAAEAVKVTFDLPAGEAGQTLKAFAQQAKREIMFPSKRVDSVQTNGVKGEMTVQEGLARLLAGTGLVVIEDQKTGALVVRGGDGPNVRQAAPVTVTPPNPTADNALSEATVVLSPFVVASERDTGYAAANTLAGTRLNTPVKDLGAAISIYTAEFLSDIGASNAGDLLVYATSMEAAGAGGNFSGAASDINATEVVGDAQRSNPQGATRSRGLASPNYTRNFFSSVIPVDTYNTDAVTVSRGPNAILFGVGSPSGIVDTALIRPNLRRDANKVEFRYGNNDSMRGILDLNRVLLRDRLAVRLAALSERERFNQRPAFEQNRRVYGAATYRPSRSTELRANFETGNTVANRPLTVLPFHSISPEWYAEGRRGFDWTFYDDPGRNPSAASQASQAFEGFLQGAAQVFNQQVHVYSSAVGAAPDLAFRGQLQSTPGNAANAYRATVVHPLVNRDAAAEAIRFIGTLNLAEINAGWWTGSRVLPGQQPGYVPAGLKMQGFTDYSAFDFQNRLLDESSRQSGSFRSFNVALEQRFLRDRLGVELAYDTQRNDRRSKNSFMSAGNANHVRIDTNLYLPDARPNPNVGRPYVTYGQSNWSNVFNQAETLRATGYLRYDFKELKQAWGLWLGRHTVTGLVEQNSAENINYGHRLISDGALGPLLNPTASTFTRRAVALVYVGPSIIGTSNPLQLEPIRIPELVAGATTPVRYFVRAGNATDLGGFVDAPAFLTEMNNGGSAQREVIRSQAGALQSYWLADHLITLVGWRRDEDYFARRSIVSGSPFFDDAQPLPSAAGKVHYGFDDLPFPERPPLNVAKEVKTYSVVARWPNRLLALPLGSELSVFINRSENFTPTGGRVDYYANPIASPEGNTREYGLNLSTLGGRLNVRVNRFETAVVRETARSPAGAANTNAVIQQASFWATEGNNNPENVGLMNAAIEKLFSVLPPNYRALYGFSVVGTAPNISSTTANLPGTTDLTDVTAKGVEVDVVYNPTRNLRIMANVAQQETILTNSYPITREFVARMLPVWNDTVSHNGITVPMRSLPRLGYPLGFGPLNPAPFGDSYGTWLDANVLVPLATGLATEGSASAEQRKWRANLASNYTFGGGGLFGERLKGWSVGTGVRWQDKLGLGYPATRNQNGSVNLDLANPYYAPAETNVDAWVAYSRRIWRDRIQWKVQLNVRNLMADDAPIGITTQPWGEVATVRLPPERRWYLTNTFRF